MNNAKHQNLNKWWFRLLKVIFILSFIVVLGLSFATTFSASKPYTDFQDSKYHYVCNDGSVHEIHSSSIIDRKYSTAVGDFDFKEETTKRVARFQCEYNSFLQSISKEEQLEWKVAVLRNEVSDITDVKNYTISFTEEVIQGSWVAFYVGLWLSIFIPIVVFFFIRYLFFYIVKNEHRLVFNEF